MRLYARCCLNKTLAVFVPDESYSTYHTSGVAVCQECGKKVTVHFTVEDE